MEQRLLCRNPKDTGTDKHCPSQASPPLLTKCLTSRQAHGAAAAFVAAEENRTSGEEDVSMRM